MIKNLIFEVSLSINFSFSGRKSQSQQKLAKKITCLNLTHFTNLNSLNIMRNILSQHSQKHVSGCFQKKNICTVSFLDSQELHSQST